MMRTRLETQFLKAFSRSAEKHCFHHEFPTVGFGNRIKVAFSFLSSLGFYSVVAEDTEGDGNKVLGNRLTPIHKIS